MAKAKELLTKHLNKAVLVDMLDSDSISVISFLFIVVLNTNTHQHKCMVGLTARRSSVRSLARAVQVFSVWRSHVLFISTWVYCVCSDFHQQSKNMQIKSIGDNKIFCDDSNVFVFTSPLCFELGRW